MNQIDFRSLQEVKTVHKAEMFGKLTESFANVVSNFVIIIDLKFNWSMFYPVRAARWRFQSSCWRHACSICSEYRQDEHASSSFLCLEAH
jgi:hypothetical protein